jgi:MFS family permease
MCQGVRVTEVGPPLLTRRFLMLALAELGYFTAEGVSFYALPLFATGPVGSGTAGAGVAFGACALMALVLRPIAGRLCDTLGRFPLLLFGSTVSVVALALTAQVDTIVSLVALRLLLGVGEAAFLVASFAALADLAPPNRMGEAVSYNSLSLYLGLAVGPLVGNVIASQSGIRSTWYGAAALMLIAVICVFGIGETAASDRSTQQGSRLIHWPAVPVGLGFLAGIVAMGGFLAFASLQAEAVNLGNTGLPLFAYGVTVLVCRVAFAKLPDRVPFLVLGVAALASISIGLLVAAVWESPAGLLTGAVLLGVGVAFSTPAFFAAMFATATSAQRGAVSATATVLLDIGFGAGPLVLGFVAQAYGLSWAFGVASAVSLVGVLWVLRVRTVPASGQ